MSTLTRAIGASSEDRTRDLILTMDTLCLLSYRSIFGGPDLTRTDINPSTMGPFYPETELIKLQGRKFGDSDRARTGDLLRDRQAD